MLRKKKSARKSKTKNRKTNYNDVGVTHITCILSSYLMYVDVFRDKHLIAQRAAHEIMAPIFKQGFCW